MSGPTAILAILSSTSLALFGVAITVGILSHTLNASIMGSNPESGRGLLERERLSLLFKSVLVATILELVVIVLSFGASVFESATGAFCGVGAWILVGVLGLIMISGLLVITVSFVISVLRY